MNRFFQQTVKHKVIADIVAFFQQRIQSYVSLIRHIDDADIVQILLVSHRKAAQVHGPS